jgi:hypothetical protein
MSVNKKNNLYEYLDFVKMAKLDCKSKALLYFYAISYNWTQNQPSWYSQRSICALVSMAQSTYHEVQKKLERLGWIQTRYRGRDRTVQVWVSVGISDPDYDQYSWAPWHPFNAESEIPETYEHDPFERRDRQEKPPSSPSKGLRRSHPDEIGIQLKDEQNVSSEEFWRAFEDPRSSIPPLPKPAIRESTTELDDLASELWGV